jgi:hypothetical protein
MGQPVWTTPPGDLGKFAEGLYFSTLISANDPYGSDVYYKLIAGALPDGIQVKTNGHIEGTPRASVKVSGVPLPVGKDITTKFAVRAYTTVGSQVSRVNDRTFQLTVTGQDIPTFVTPPGLLGTFYDGSTISYQILFSDDDPNDTVVVSVASGKLPNGLSISSFGLITGYIAPVALLPSTAIAGWDRSTTKWDEFPYDFTTRSSNKRYQFSLQITDGKDINIRTFEMFVISRDSISADSTEFTADHDNFVTVDATTNRLPFLVDFDNITNDLGVFNHNNWFAYKFDALDLDGEPVAYTVSSLAGLPPGLSINTNTGWLYGNISDIGIAQLTYTFSVQVYQVSNPSVVSLVYNFSITIKGGAEEEIKWVSSDFLGTISNGGTSMFNVTATTNTVRHIKYKLKATGVYNKLPQGLKLLESGNIVGNVTFNTYTLDAGTTTFDDQLSTRLKINKTTVDMNRQFTVNAYTDDGLLSVFKTFTIKVLRIFNEPFETVYANASPPASDRGIISALIGNPSIIPLSLVYRNDDPSFGIANKVQYVHAHGVKSATVNEYISALEKNHYRKSLLLGEIKTAQALDSNDNVVYEVVYTDIVDTAAIEGTIPAAELKWSSAIPNGAVNNTVYPNSLISMRNYMLGKLGHHETTLPLWMISKQKDGSIPFFVRAWVIAYCKPGQSNRVIYNIKQIFTSKLNDVDFDIDRYTVNRQLTKNWVPSETSLPGSWLPAEITTFDLSLSKTTFDQGSINFISPVDLATNTDMYDKYIMFPRTNILG